MRPFEPLIVFNLRMSGILPVGLLEQSFGKGFFQRQEHFLSGITIINGFRFFIESIVKFIDRNSSSDQCTMVPVMVGLSDPLFS